MRIQSLRDSSVRLVRKTIIRGVLLLVVLSSARAQADIIKGALTFDDNAFADDATMIVGTIDDFFGGATSVAEALSGPDLSKGFDLNDFEQDEIVEIVFSDNVVFNGAGADLVVYEGAVPDGFDVAVGLGGGTFSPFVHFEPVAQGFAEGPLAANAALVDLTASYGLASGFLVNVIRVREDDTDTPELTGAAALHSAVPEPSIFVLIALSLVGLGWRRQKRA